jgi:hypothetical protein
MPALGDIWAGVQVRTVIVAMLCFKQVEIGKGHDAVIIIVSIAFTGISCSVSITVSLVHLTVCSASTAAVKKGQERNTLPAWLYNCWQVFVCRIYLETKRNCQGNYINGYG